MRRIQKTFSLEPMTSRMPSVLPAYKDNVLYYFDDNSLKARDYKYPSNYGMIPLNVRLSGVTFNDGILSAKTGWSGVTLTSSQCFCEEYERPCNAMIPKEIETLCETSDEDVSAHTQFNSLCDFTISFERLSDWYHFFKEYYHLMNDYGHCDRTYSSATEYYYYESGTRYANQMLYGTYRNTYEDIDAEFKAKGGVVNITNSGTTDVGFYKWICDNIVPSYYISKDYSGYWKRDKLYYPDVVKWIAWFSSRLWYEEEEGVEVYSAATYDEETNKIIEKEHWDCKNSAVTDCCDCEEYFNRGGKREHDRMLAWYNAVQSGISANNQSISANVECFIPTMDDKIELQNTLDDLGQYSIFSKEYELGIDYRTASYGDSTNTHGGTVAEISGNTMILREGADGFCFSPYYMEKVCDENAWEDYRERYMHDSLCPQCGYYGVVEGDTCPACGYKGIIRNSSEFVADGYRYYTYDLNNVMYTGNTIEEVSAKTQTSAYTYDIVKTDAILIDNVLYPIGHSEYGIYDLENKYLSGMTFFVYREKDTSTPYTLIHGKKIYAEWYPNPNPDFDNKPCYYFVFFKKNNLNKGVDCGIVDDSFNITNYKPFGRKQSDQDEDVIDYITYMGQMLEVSGGTLAIDGLEYYRVSGYAYTDDNQLLYCISGNVVNSDTDTYRYSGETSMIDHWEIIPKSSISGDTIYIGLDYEPHIYDSRELIGQTASRITDLQATNLLIDDIGNEIDGKYDPNKSNIYNHQPPQGTELDLLYDVGNTSNIRRFRLTESANTVTINYFVGNIITDMSFYYKDINGNRVSATTVDVYFEDSDAYSIKVKGKYIDKSVTSGSTSLSAITASTSARTEIENNTSSTTVFDGDDIYCDVTYYIGATLSRKENEGFKLAYSANTNQNNYNYGVQYNETVRFVKENREYYLKKMVGKQIPTSFNTPSSHTVSYPIYVYKLTQDIVDVDANLYNTTYKSAIANFKTEINLINSGLTSNFSGYTDMDAYNNIHVSPTLKQEYMLGISSLENIDSDIYIERGINAAFERHLKLGEVTSMEALEQYSNGYFKIIDN